MKRPQAFNGKLYLVPAVYFFLAMLWILGSDALVWGLFSGWPAEALKDVSMLKGLSFAALSALFVSWLLHRNALALGRAGQNLRRIVRRINHVSRAHRRTANELDAIFEQGLVGIVFVDSALTIRRVNKGFLAMAGGTQEGMVDRGVCDIAQSGCGLCAELASAVARCREGADSVELEFETRRSFGPAWIQISVTRIRTQGDASGYVALTRDITDRKRNEEHIAYLSYYDFLTDLPNRRLFTEKLSDACKRTKRYGGGFAVFYLDIDNFKHYNDTRGHEFGDAVLKAFAATVRGSLRDSDVLARIGGDEFAAILSGVEKRSTCEKLVRKLQVALAEVRRVEGLPTTLKASIGFGLFPVDGDTVDALLNVADRDMYTQKELHRSEVAMQ